MPSPTSSFLPPFSVYYVQGGLNSYVAQASLLELKFLYLGFPHARVMTHITILGLE